MYSREMGTPHGENAFQNTAERESFPPPGEREGKKGLLGSLFSSGGLRELKTEDLLLLVIGYLLLTDASGERNDLLILLLGVLLLL